MTGSGGEIAALADWGTSSLRIWLVGREGTVLSKRRCSQGMKRAAELGFERVLENELECLDAPPHAPAVICGMAGAKGGWLEAGYQDVRAPLTDIAPSSIRTQSGQRDIYILPGIACHDQERPDIMRGEETILLGLGALGKLLRDQHICIPGTHAKWICIEAARIQDFKTYMTGELFGAIASHTILSQSIGSGSSVTGPREIEAFRHGIKTAWGEPTSLTHHLFTIRANAVLFDTDPNISAATLSGLLIGSEIFAELGKGREQKSITLLASGDLADLYLIAMKTLGVDCAVVDAEHAALEGLSRAAAELGLLNRAD